MARTWAGIRAHRTRLPQCSDCVTGRYHPSSGSTCHSCASGQYSAWAAQDNCLHCPSGKYQDKEAYHQCHLCDVSMWTEGNTGSTTCVAVPTASPTPAPSAGACPVSTAVGGGFSTSHASARRKAAEATTEAREQEDHKSAASTTPATTSSLTSPPSPLWPLSKSGATTWSSSSSRLARRVRASQL